MNENPESNSESGTGQSQGYIAHILKFIAEVLVGLARDAVKFLVAFVIGTGAGAIACWYYGLPLGLSLLGGILILALALALSTDSIFS